MSKPHNPFTPHPRTVLWMMEREQCRVCRHCAIVAESSRNPARSTGPGGWWCLASRPIKKAKHKHEAYCIDARESGQPCGPEGRLFSPKKA